ncbi:MAG TPA: alpha/beta hydrolase [Ktedonobacteraceae bacterium]
MAISPVDNIVTAHGLHMHYRHWLPHTAHPTLPPVLLIHGLASASHIWNFVAPLLAEQGYDVIALDQRGHGESEKPDHGYDFSTILADDRAFLQALNLERPVLVGHSWGAMVALQYAGTYPEDCNSLVLVDGATNQLSQRPDWTREQARQMLAPPRFAGTPREAFLSRIRSTPLGQQWSAELEDIMLHIIQLRDDDTVAPRLDFEHHLQIIDAMWDQPTVELYERARCPVTIIVADQEESDEQRQLYHRLRAESIEHIQQRNSTIHIVWMRNTIHDIPLQRPLELAEEIVRAARPRG